MRYTVRPLGRTAWAETDSLREAKKLRDECYDRMSNNETVVIVDNRTNEIVHEAEGLIEELT